MEYEQITLMEVIASLEGNGSRPSHKGSGIGDKDVSFTLNATEQHAIALAEQHASLSAQDGRGANHSQKLKNPEENYVLETFGIGSKDSNAMKSKNPHSGIYKADTSRTLDLNGGNPACNQGGMAVCVGNGQLHDAMKPEGICKTLNCMADPMKIVEYNEICGTLAASDYKFPQQQQVEEGKCIVEVSEAVKELNETAPHQQDLLNDSEGIARTLAVGCHGSSKHFTKTVVKNPTGFKNSSFGQYEECETGGTLKANGGDFQGGETVVNDYAVRRLTPIETERLQGMPDMWCYGLETDNPTDEELDFWLDAFETHRKIVTGASKPKTEKQIKKFLSTPLTDSAVYKIQGNGMGLPNMLFVIEGIAKAERGEL